MSRFRFLTTLVTLLLLLLGGGLTWAAEREGIGISPTRVLLEANSGDELSREVRGLNDGDVDVTYHLYAEAFRVTNENYDKQFGSSPPGTLAPETWIDIPKGDRLLKAHTQESVPYALRIPPRIPSGGYYAVIFAETRPPELKSTGVRQIKRVGTLIYLTVSGNLERKGKLSSYRVDLFQSRKPILAEYRVKNEGNVHFEVASTLRLRNLFGKVVQEVRMEGVVLPGTTRKFLAEFRPPHSIGIFKIEGELKFLDQEPRLSEQFVLLASPGWIGLSGAALLALVWVAYSTRRREKRPRGGRRS